MKWFSGVTLTMIENTAATRSDLTGRADIITLVDRFYERVRADVMLGPIFDGIAQVNWDKHLPKLYDFWDTVLFQASTFRGNLIGTHAQLIPAAAMGRSLFEHWLALFRETVAELFEGPNAARIVLSAENMADVIHSKIHRLPDPRFDPALLTEEQRQRYARYRGE